MVRAWLVAGWLMVAAMGTRLAVGQRPEAASPPMGWNSWDAYGLRITEAEFRANVEVLKDKLLPFGWRYAVIDEGWYFENPQDREKPATLRYAIDRYGRYVPVPERFPSAGKTADAGAERFPEAKLAAKLEDTSFAALGSWVHAQGLQFGVHIVRGIPRVSVERKLPIEGSGFHAEDAADESDACPWDPTNWGVKDNAAGQAWYDSLLRQYAAWGVDLIKVDCIADQPYKADEIRMIRRAIDKAGRPMVLSLSPGPTGLGHASEVAELANMWRMSNDIWDVWDSKGEFPQGVKNQFVLTAAWAKFAKPGNWPDADMLPLGELRPSPGWEAARTTRLNAEEQQTMVTLWAMARSPLILGANLTLLDEATLKLLTNREVIAIDQTATGRSEVLHEGSLIAWRAEMPGGKVALAVFNVGDAAERVDRRFEDFGVAKKGRVRNVWSGEEMGRVDRLAVDVAGHGCVLVELR